ncbi:MAG TPA: glycosyltransferase family 10 [Trichocoleus sp.]
MVSSYPGLTQGDWLWKQTPDAFGSWGKIQMVAPHAQPDFLLLYQYDFFSWRQSNSRSWRRSLKDKVSATLFSRASRERTPDLDVLFRNVPQERRVYLLREPPLKEISQKNRTNYEFAQRYCRYVSGPDEFAPTPNYMPAIWYVDVSFRELAEMPAPIKVKPCSWITSGISRTENHRNRLNFLRSVQESEFEVDFYGRGLPSWVSSLGALNNKWHALAPYYYNLAIENYADNPWYVSEKLWDALLGWCLPIYYGGSAADALLPAGSFLRLPSMDEKGLAFIREVTATPDAWFEAQSAIAEARQIILHKLNLLNWLSEYVEQFS